jgi:hypothetical protein
VYIHDFGEGRLQGCEYEDVLIPLMWLVTVHQKLEQDIVNTFRHGLSLNYLPSPFLHWVLQSKEGIPNIF